MMKVKQSSQLFELFLIIVSVMLLFASLPVHADNVLTWKPVQALEGGESYTPVSADVVTLYRNGVKIIALPGTAITWTDIGASRCAGYTYYATFTVTATNLTSTNSNNAKAAVDEVKCRPKPMTELTAG